MKSGYQRKGERPCLVQLVGNPIGGKKRLQRGGKDPLMMEESVLVMKRGRFVYGENSKINSQQQQLIIRKGGGRAPYTKEPLLATKGNPNDSRTRRLPNDGV